MSYCGEIHGMPGKNWNFLFQSSNGTGEDHSRVIQTVARVDPISG